ncbi:MAG: putative porin [Cytophagales bacterium]
MFFRTVIFVVIFCCTIAGTVAQKKDSTLQKRRVIKTVPASSSDEPKKRTTSKIINDSVKQVYGPKTSTWTTENDMFYGIPNYRPLDTAIQNFHRWNYVQRGANAYQDLGNMGTALQPLFPQLPATIGLTTGYRAFAPYFEWNEPRYYDTKSPYTRVYVVWGGRGRATTHIEFSRNINPRWNFGFNYRAILVEKQLPYVSRSYQTQSHYYDFFTTYKGKDDKYSLVFNYRRIRHRVKENGGVLLSSDTSFNAFFLETVKPYWANAQNEDYRVNLHLHQRYQVDKAVQFYLTTDYSLEENTFTIDKSDSASNFFKTAKPVSYYNARNTGILFKNFQNEVGIKGNAHGLFYDFYGKVRMLDVFNKPVLRDSTPISNFAKTELYLGSRIVLRLDSFNIVRASGEYLLDGNYRIEGSLNTPWLEASLYNALTKPGVLQQNFRGIRAFWQNDFSNTFVNQLKGNLKLKAGKFFLSPGVTYTLLSNQLFFRNDYDTIAGSTPKIVDNIKPVQSMGNQQLFSLNLNASVNFLKNFYLRPQVIYTKLFKNDDSAIRVPDFFINCQLSYERFLFKKALQMQLGLDLFYRSDYKALGYAPDLQSYYNQDSKVVEGYLVSDVFLNAKIKGGRLFVKYHNAANIFLKPGYMLTWGYPAIGNILDFGFEIPLFD